MKKSKMTDKEARRIAEFAVFVRRYRGWVFSMREGLEGDEWGDVERLVSRVAKRRAAERKGEAP